MELIESRNGLGVYSNGSATFIIKDIKTGERYEMTNTARKAKNAFNRVGVMAGYWAAA